MDPADAQNDRAVFPGIQDILPALLRGLAAPQGVGVDAPRGGYSLVSLVLAATSQKGRREEGHYGPSQEPCGMR